MYDWNDLRIFLAVVRAGSALGASKSLGINHSTVNRRIQALEHALGLKLFDRQNRGHKLTGHGRTLLAGAEQVKKSAIDVQSAAERLRRTVAGVVRVTAPEALAARIIVPIAAEFQKCHPDVRVEQVAAESRLDIVHGEADVAFRVGTHPDDPRLVAQRLLDAQWTVYCSNTYAQASEYPRDPSGETSHDVVIFTGSAGNFPDDPWFLSMGGTAHVVGHSNTVPNLHAVLKSGLGIGALPCFIGDADPDLIRCFDPPPMQKSEIWLLTSQEARNSPQVRAFIDFAIPRIREWKQRFHGQITA